MTALAVICLVLIGIYVIFGSIRQHRLLINKTVVIISAIAIGILVFQGSITKNDPQQITLPYYQQIAPSVQQAPYVLQTSSRAYYISTYQDGEEGLLLTNFYFYNKKQWENSDIPLPFPKSIFGDLEVFKRYVGG